MKRPFRLTAPIADEDAEHEALAKALRYLIGEAGITNRDGVLWFSIEHKIRSAKSATAASIEGAMRRRRGVVGGVPDIYLRWPGATGWIELKRTHGSGGPSDIQKVRHAELRRLGDVVIVGLGWVDSLRRLREAGVPMRPSTMA